MMGMLLVAAMLGNLLAYAEPSAAYALHPGDYVDAVINGDEDGDCANT